MIEDDLCTRVRIYLWPRLCVLNNNLLPRQRIVSAVNSIRQRVPRIGLKGSYDKPYDRKLCQDLHAL